MRKTSKASKVVTVSNVFLVAAIIFVAALLFAPGFKSSIISGLMKFGLFQPDVKRLHIATPLSSNSLATTPVYLRDKDDHRLNLASLKGQVVFINVWATWCPPCKAELPSINKLKSDFNDDKNVVFLTIDADGHPDKAANYLAQNHLNLPVYALDGQVPEMLSSDAIPYTIVLDKNGFLVYKHSGAADYSRSKFVEFLKDLTQ